MGGVPIASYGLSVAAAAGLLQRKRNSSPPSVLRMGSTSTKGTMRGMLVVAMASYEAGIGVMGTKLGMMTYIEPEGKVVPVTVVGFREGNIVTQVKTSATDGYPPSSSAFLNSIFIFKFTTYAI
jgi:hypothetical protein